MADLDYARVEAALIGTAGADYAQVRHSVIPPGFAPTEWLPAINRFLKRYPFETNVFCMTRFPKPGDGDSQEMVISSIRDVVSMHGLSLHLASDRQIADNLFANVVGHIWASQYGIGLLEDRASPPRGLNSNVLIELGSMLVMGRRCAILRDLTAPYPPSDLSGQIYKSVSFDDLKQTTDAVHRWLSEDLGLSRCPACPHPVELGAS